MDNDGYEHVNALRDVLLSVLSQILKYSLVQLADAVETGTKQFINTAVLHLPHNITTNRNILHI